MVPYGWSSFATVGDRGSILRLNTWKSLLTSHSAGQEGRLLFYHVYWFINVFLKVKSMTSAESYIVFDFTR